MPKILLDGCITCKRPHTTTTCFIALISDDDGYITGYKKPTNEIAPLFLQRSSSVLSPCSKPNHFGTFFNYGVWEQGKGGNVWLE